MTATATTKLKSNRFSYQNNNSPRASRLFVHFYAVPARLLREMTKFKSFLRTGTARRLIVSSMRKLGCGPSLQLQRKIPSFKYLATWDNREMVWKDAESIFQRGFHGRPCCQILMSLIPVTAWYRDSTHPIRRLWSFPSVGRGGGRGEGGWGMSVVYFPKQWLVIEPGWTLPFKGLWAPEKGLDQSHIHKNGGQCHLYHNPLASVYFCFIG